MAVLGERRSVTKVPELSPNKGWGVIDGKIENFVLEGGINHVVSQPKKMNNSYADTIAQSKWETREGTSASSRRMSASTSPVLKPYLIMIYLAGAWLGVSLERLKSHSLGSTQMGSGEMEI